MPKPIAPQAALAAYALTLPGATEDHPWGETAIKVAKKVFVFLGMPGVEVSVTTKLPESGMAALALPFAEPTGYGLGKSGWVTFRFGPKEPVPLDLLRQFIDESYRAVAPKKLVDSWKAVPAAAPAPTPRRRKTPDRTPGSPRRSRKK